MKTPKLTRVSVPRSRLLLGYLLATLLPGAWPGSHAAPAPNHGIVAANIGVLINDFLNTTNSVTLSLPYAIGDFRLNPELSTNGDYAVQIGATRTNDVPDGILITSVCENGRDDGNILYPGTNFATSHIDYNKPGPPTIWANRSKTDTGAPFPWFGPMPTPRQ